MADNNQDSHIPRPPSQGRYSPAIPNLNGTHLGQSTLSPTVSRSPSLRGMVASPPHSPRLPGHQSHHTRSPSFSSTLNMVDILAAGNGAKPVARDWTKITVGELVQGQKLVFVDGDTPVEEACQVFSPMMVLMVDVG